MVKKEMKRKKVAGLIPLLTKLTFADKKVYRVCVRIRLNSLVYQNDCEKPQAS